MLIELPQGIPLLRPVRTQGLVSNLFLQKSPLFQVGNGASNRFSQNERAVIAAFDLIRLGQT